MTLGRPLNFDTDTVLEAAMRLFWQQGYEATSLQALLRVMNLSKSSLYQAFGNKQQLFLRCLDRYHAQMIDTMSQRLVITSGFEFVRQTLAEVVDEAVETPAPKGCLVTNTANEFAQSDLLIARKIAAGLAGYEEMFAQAALKGQADGSIRSDMPAALLATYLVTSMSGLRTLVKAGTDPAALTQTVTVILETIKKKSG